MQRPAQTYILYLGKTSFCYLKNDLALSLGGLRRRQTPFKLCKMHLLHLNLKKRKEFKKKYSRKKLFSSSSWKWRFTCFPFVLAQSLEISAHKKIRYFFLSLLKRIESFIPLVFEIILKCLLLSIYVILLEFQATLKCSTSIKYKIGKGWMIAILLFT